MRIGIDASNLRAGGGVTHLIELLRAARPSEHGISQLLVWGGRRTLERLPQRPEVTLIHEPLLDGPLPQRTWWQKTRLDRLAADQCDLLFVPGSTYTGHFRPFVTMSRNLIPFDPAEIRRYGRSWMRLRNLLLARSQSATFRRATGTIFLTQVAQQVTEAHTGRLSGRTAVIPHGVAEVFRRPPRPQRPLAHYSPQQPFRLLYVSSVDFYKHQWHVVAAVAQLRAKGLPVALDLIGPAYPPALARLQAAMEAADPQGDFIRYHGSIPYAQLVAYYHHSDAFVFASSCETFGQILLEAMASGLPIACAERSAMPELLGDAGLYFDPENPNDIANTFEQLISQPTLRERLACCAHERAHAYSWPRCARETFDFLVEVGGLEN